MNSIKKKYSIIVLAAGLGKRMLNLSVPKVLTELDKHPLLYYILKTAISLEPQKICIVVGYQKELVIDYVNNDFLPEFTNFSPMKIEFAFQEEQLGTGHAVLCCGDNFSYETDDILILSGDVPLLQKDTLENFILQHYVLKNDISVLSATTKEPYSYGRIVRDNCGKFISIVEEKDVSSEQKQIKEINSGIYFLNSKLLFKLLQNVKNNNNQHEYYLTDIIFHGKDVKKEAINIVNPVEIQGVNTVEQLKEMEQMLIHLHNNICSK